MYKNLKEFKGITLIALIITIIILLILAGVAISTLADNGLFEKAKLAKLRSYYVAAKEKVEIKLMEVQADCIGHGREYTIEEIAKNIKADKEITIEKYYNESTSLIGTGVTENLVSLEGIVVSVDKYEEYKFLLGESCEIEGITMEEITDTTTLEDFASPEEFEKEVLGKVPSNNNNNNGNDDNDDDIVEEPEEEIKDVPAVGEDVDTTSPIEITTYMSIKSNTKNTLNLSGVEGATYTVQEKTGNVNLSENILTANNNAGSTDSCKIQITGTYSGQNYTNNLTVYVEPKNLTTVTDEEGNTLEAFAIYEVEDLIRIRELVNSKVNDTFNAKMMKDIDLADIEWNPIGYYVSDNDVATFKGIFDGQNYTINNMEINLLGSEYSYAGFIGALEGGILKNLKFNNPDVYSERMVSAIAVGSSHNNSIIENVAILNGVIETTNNYTGGICASNETNSIIRNCYNNSAVSSQSPRIGGICGNNYSSSIDSCYNTGNITSLKTTSGNALAGGIVGINIYTSTVQNCYNTGNVTGTRPYIGGIVGHNGESDQGTQTVMNVFNTGIITKETITATADIGTSSNYVGTLIGGHGALTENYENTTKAAMALWDSDTILQNLGASFKKNNNSNLNDGLPIL